MTHVEQLANFVVQVSYEELSEEARQQLKSEGITESVDVWRTDVPARVANALGIEKGIFSISRGRWGGVRAVKPPAHPPAPGLLKRY